MHTHYDTLKVARDAPAEVVRAAYRALSLKYHPDRHAADSEATAMMALLNSAYDVLSDPEKRRDYDEWVKFQESRPPDRRGERSSGRGDWIGAPSGAEAGSSSRLLSLFSRFRNYWVFYVFSLIAIFVGSVWYESVYRHRSKALVPIASAVSPTREEAPATSEPSPFARRAPPPDTSSPEKAAPDKSAEANDASQSEREAAPLQPDRPTTPTEQSHTPKPPAQAATPPGATAPAHKSAKPRDAKPPVRAAQAPDSPPAPRVRKTVERPQAPITDAAVDNYSRPATAPNGESWPSSSDYVPGYPQRNTNGLSQVVIDNSKNNSDAFVKIVSVGDSEPKVVRNVFIQANDRFTVNNMRAGSYELRYQNLETGALIRSEVFALEESAISSGTRYSAVTLTLRGHPDESMNTYALSPGEF
jgi:curved DNA-binding protein CbpA